MATYFVTLGDVERLVEAKSEAQAVRHITRQLVDCRVATIEEANRLGLAGTKIEKAGRESEDAAGDEQQPGEQEGN